MSKRKRTPYEKLLRKIRKLRLSSCQRMEVAAMVGYQLGKVEEYTPRQRGRRGLNVFRHDRIDVKVPPEMKAWLTSLVADSCVVGGSTGFLYTLLVIVKDRPALIAEVIQKAGVGRTAAPRSEDRTDAATDESEVSR